MKGIVLVGGEGTRLRPLTYTTPKQMLPVAEVSMIERVVAHLSAHGVTDVVLSLGYRPDAFTAAYPDNRCAGASLTYVVEAQPLDTAGAIRFAATQAGVDGTFLVFNGDVLTDLDITALVAFHRSHGAEGTISLTPVEDPSSFGVVPTSADDRVEAFIEKPAPGTAPTNLINAGTYVLEPSVLDRIAPEGRVNVERETFPAMVAAGSLYAMPATGYWLDVGTPERYLASNFDLLSGIRPGPPAPGAVEVSAGVWTLGAPTVQGKVSGSLIGDGAVVVDGASVAGAVVGAGATVGRAAVVARSVLLPGAQLGEGAEVTDSIVGPGVRVGAGAQLRDVTMVGAGVTVEAGSHHAGARLAG